MFWPCSGTKCRCSGVPKENHSVNCWRLKNPNVGCRAASGMPCWRSGLGTGSVLFNRLGMWYTSKGKKTFGRFALGVILVSLLTHLDCQPTNCSNSMAGQHSIADYVCWFWQESTVVRVCIGGLSLQVKVLLSSGNELPWQQAANILTKALTQHQQWQNHRRRNV